MINKFIVALKLSFVVCYIAACFREFHHLRLGEYKLMNADKQKEIIAFVLRSILLAKLYTNLRSNSSNVGIP